MPTLPTLPQLTVDTTYSLPTGTTFTPANSAAFATALTNAALNDIIVLTAGVTYTGPFTLPNKTTGSGWIYIVSSALTSLPAAGTRVAVTDATNMPIIEATSAGVTAISTADIAHHFRFVGIQFKPAAGQFVFQLVTLGNADTSTSTLPHHIIFDRCYIHGDPTVGGRRGVAMNGDSIVVIESYVSDFKENGSDTQALWSYNGNGPFKIHNNYLEASGENVMFGGKGASITNLIPSDITITRNYFSKPLSWVPLTWTVKNLLEFKNAQRVLVEGNIFENSWAAAQAGWAILLTPRNDEGVTPWQGVQDITFRLNKLTNVGQGITGLGRDNVGGSTLILERILIENNLILIQNIANEDHRLLQFLNAAALSGAGPNNLTIRHNTGLILSVGGGGTGASQVSEMLGVKADQFDFRDNLLSAGSDGNGFFGSGTAAGTPTLVAYYTNYTMLNNAFIQGVGTYPATNLFPTNTTAVGFVNFAGGNYRLTSSSVYHNAASDGTDIGANIDAIEAAITGNAISRGPQRLGGMVTLRA